ncbi:MAG: restriction endonuclease subunit S [Clostridiales bacterium]|nr:restriction endonuclease subunit S [Clostridiales bacterium]
MAGLLGDYIKINHGYAFDGDMITTEDNGTVLVMPRNIARNGGFQENNCKFYTGDYPDAFVLRPGDLVISMTDMSREGYILGCPASIPSSKRRTYLLNQGISRIDVVRDDVDKRYIYWFMRSPYYHKSVVASSTGSVIRHTKPSLINRIEVSFPCLEEQKKAASVLDAIEDKMRINHRMIRNLEEHVLAVYKKKFIHTDNGSHKECSLGEVFHVFIGRTPPRKEPLWFSTDPAEIPWVLISDMREGEPFISDSATHLTQESLKRFHIKMVPDNTVLLTFKMTIGRVAFADGVLVTNEAIAHFISDRNDINEYLYCYLKYFPYEELDTSSTIVAALNKRTIKNMPFIMPEEEELKRFHEFAEPLFRQIKVIQRENVRLQKCRETLLPRIMMGEVDVSGIRI